MDHHQTMQQSSMESPWSHGAEFVESFEYEKWESECGSHTSEYRTFYDDSDMQLHRRTHTDESSGSGGSESIDSIFSILSQSTYSASSVHEPTRDYVSTTDWEPRGHGQYNTRETPSTLGWTADTDLIRLYCFIVRGAQEPYFHLQDRWTPSANTPEKVYLDPPSQPKHGQFPCQYPSNCRREFKTSVALQRHYINVHCSYEQKSHFECDYSRCSRSNDPFTRKDHYRDHLREFHREDIGCVKGARKMDDDIRRKAQDLWWSERHISVEWWRCTKCLTRVYSETDGWRCMKCAQPCESERVERRLILQKEKFTSLSPNTSGMSRGGAETFPEGSEHSYDLERADGDPNPISPVAPSAFDGLNVSLTMAGLPLLKSISGTPATRFITSFEIRAETEDDPDMSMIDIAVQATPDTKVLAEASATSPCLSNEGTDDSSRNIPPLERSSIPDTSMDSLDASNPSSSILTDSAQPLMESKECRLTQRPSSVPMESSDRESASPTSSECQSSDSSHTDSDNSMYDELCENVDILHHEQAAGHLLSSAKANLIDRIMEEFWVMFNDRCVRQYTGGCSAGSSSSLTQDQGAASDALSSRSSPAKRRQVSRENGGDDFSEDEVEDHPPSSAKSATTEPHNSVRFACPFRKFNPRKYNIYFHRGVCAISHWGTIARLKEHLYRCHRIAPHCVRCWNTFKTEIELSAHYKAEKMCKQQESGSVPDGITSEQERKLRSRKRARHEQSAEEKWAEMYRILFPGADIPSPYFEEILQDNPMSPDSQSLAHYEEYRRRELPRLFRADVEELLRREMQHIAEPLLESLVGIFQDCQDRTFQSYLESVGQVSAVDDSPKGPTQAPGDTNDPHQHHILDESSHPNTLDSSFLEAMLQQPPHASDFPNGLPMEQPDQETSQFSSFFSDISLPVGDNATSDSGYGSSSNNTSLQSHPRDGPAAEDHVMVNEEQCWQNWGADFLCENWTDG